MLAMIATAFAQLPSEAVDNTKKNVSTLNRTVVNPYDPAYIWKNPYAIDLSGVGSAIFNNAAFAKSPGGLASATYTPSINEFLKDDGSLGRSNITATGTHVGRTVKTAYVGSSVPMNAVPITVPQSTVPQSTASGNATI